MMQVPIAVYRALHIRPDFKARWEHVADELETWEATCDGCPVCENHEWFEDIECECRNTPRRQRGKT